MPALGWGQMSDKSDVAVPLMEIPGEDRCYASNVDSGVCAIVGEREDALGALMRPSPDSEEARKLPGRGDH